MKPFITTTSGGGEYYVTVKVQSLPELHEAHDRVLACFSALPAPDDGLVELHGCHGTEPTGDDRGHFYCREVWDAIARAKVAEQQVQKLTAENERLEANIVRLTGNPVDHRYWEGRYRDERAENERLREALAYAAKGLDHVHNGLMDPSRPRQSVGEVCLHFLTAARSALATQEGGE